MKKKSEHTNKTDEGKPHFIREENVNEGWTVTPIGNKPGDPLPDDSDLFDDDDPSFYT